MGCCQGSDCDCYEEGFDDGRNNAENDLDTYNLCLDKSVVNIADDVKVWRLGDGWIARIHIDLPHGIGSTEKEAMGDLISKLIEAKLTLVAMRRF